MKWQNSIFYRKSTYHFIITLFKNNFLWNLSYGLIINFKCLKVTGLWSSKEFLGLEFYFENFRFLVVETCQKFLIYGTAVVWIFINLILSQYIIILLRQRRNLTFRIIIIIIITFPKVIHLPLQAKFQCWLHFLYILPFLLLLCNYDNFFQLKCFL